LSDFGVGLAHDCRVRSGLPSGMVTFVFSDVAAAGAGSS
jgi:hypothetical protein